eukprot:GEMP01032472.1.p1 GENE.GEMP01032472.1~~GEMP01032472.1.p1  ORF type:complete len:333 (+),score=44.21 GEMP01032472.1:189-1187(+)
MMEKDGVYVSREHFERELQGVAVDTWEEFTRRVGSEHISEGPSKVLTWIGVILINGAITAFIAVASKGSWELGLGFTLAYGIALLIFLLRPGELQKHIASRMWPLIPPIVGIIGWYVCIAFGQEDIEFVLFCAYIPHLVAAIMCLLLVKAPPLWINIFVGTVLVIGTTMEWLKVRHEITNWVPFSIGAAAIPYYLQSVRRLKEHPYDAWILHLGAAFYSFGLFLVDLIWPLTLVLQLPIFVIGIASDSLLILIFASFGVLNCCFRLGSDVFDLTGTIGSSLTIAACGSLFIYFAMRYSERGYAWRNYILRKLGAPHQPLHSELLVASASVTP